MNRYIVKTQYWSPLGGGVYETVASSLAKAVCNVKWQIRRELGIRLGDIVTKYWSAKVAD